MSAGKIKTWTGQPGHDAAHTDLDCSPDLAVDPRSLPGAQQEAGYAQRREQSGFAVELEHLPAQGRRTSQTEPCKADEREQAKVEDGQAQHRGATLKCGPRQGVRSSGRGEDEQEPHAEAGPARRSRPRPTCILVEQRVDLCLEACIVLVKRGPH